MMNYFTIVIRETQAIYRYDNRDEAIAKFHEELAYGHNARIETTALVIDQTGNYIHSPEMYAPPVETIN